MSEFLTGFQKVKVIAINPDSYWIEDVLSVQEELEYTFSDRQGVKHCILDIYFQDNKDNIFKSQIYLRDELKKGKSNNFLYVNQIGDTQWVNDESQLFSSFKHWEKILSWGINGQKIEKYKVGASPLEKEIVEDKKYHIAIEGEDQILQFLKAFHNYNPYDTDVNIFLDLQKLFDGDFSTLNRKINNGEDFHLVIFVYVNKKMEQKVLNYFFPITFFRDVCNDMQISNSHRKQYTEFLKKLEYVEGYWEVGKMKKFTPEIKNVRDDDSDY